MNPRGILCQRNADRLKAVKSGEAEVALDLVDGGGVGGIDPVGELEFRALGADVLDMRVDAAF